MLEIRPPVPVDKGQGISAHCWRRSDASTALYGGDDVTDLDAFDALDSLVAGGRPGRCRAGSGVRSDEGPAAIVDRADLVVDGVSGFTDVLVAPGRA